VYVAGVDFFVKDKKSTDSKSVILLHVTGVDDVSVNVFALSLNYMTV